MRKFSGSRGNTAKNNAPARGIFFAESSFISSLVNTVSATTLRQLFSVITRFKLLYPDWRGYLVSFFALVWVANQYMSIYNRLRLDIKHEQVEIKADENEG